MATGAYTLNAKRGESSGSALFTIGLTKGSGAISVQTTRDEYKPGEQILILGNTGSINVLLDITIQDSNGDVVKKIETFSDAKKDLSTKLFAPLATIIKECLLRVNCVFIASKPIAKTPDFFVIEILLKIFFLRIISIIETRSGEKIFETPK